jgi:hypothetical protein
MRDVRSIRNVNLLYLSAFLLLLVGGILLPPVSLGWRVVINELLFVALPLTFYLMLTGADGRRVVRLRGVSWAVAGLSLLIGLGLWRFDWWLASTLNELLDYTIPLPPEALNVTVLDRILMAVGTVILAPVVEEFLFRGAIQAAYERQGGARAVVVSSLLFIAIHQELAQSVALVPVALALGFVAWRTRSVIPAVLIHLANNGQALAVAFLEGTNPERAVFTPSPLGALVGGLVAVAALVLLVRLTVPREPGTREPRRSWLGRNWPLIPIPAIYAAVLGLGILFGIRPEALSLGQRVELASAPWEGTTRWRYEVQNAVDEPVGEAECTVAREGASFVLECAMEQAAYEADAPTGFFQEGAVAQRQTVRWDRETLALEEARIEATVPQGEEPVELTATVEDQALSVGVDGEGGQEPFDPCYLLDGSGQEGDSPPVEAPCEVDDVFLAGGGPFSPLMAGGWPWRLSALPFQLAYSREATLLWPYRGVEGGEGRVPAKQDVFVVVRTADLVTTPAGEFVTWRVTVGDTHTAWYTVDAPHHLVAYDDGMVHWQLTEVTE